MWVRVMERVTTNINMSTATADMNPCNIARLSTTSIKPSLKKPSKNEISPACIQCVSACVLIVNECKDADLKTDDSSYRYLVRLGIVGFSMRIRI